MNNMRWSKRYEDDNNTVVQSSTLYLYHYADAEYDGDDSTMVELGGCDRLSSGGYSAYVAYSITPNKSRSPHYGEQSDTRKLNDDFVTYEDAVSTVEKFAAKYFRNLASSLVAA